MPRERLSALVAEYIPMATTVQKITLSPSRDIPFNKLLLSQSNVRRVKAGVSVEELAEDIARRGLLQGLSEAWGRCCAHLPDVGWAPTDAASITAQLRGADAAGDA
jgi:hypothetical protein